MSLHSRSWTLLPKAAVCSVLECAKRWEDRLTETKADYVAGANCSARRTGGPFVCRGIVFAYQWFVNGDHPNDDRDICHYSHGDPFLGEGKIVRCFRHPSIPGGTGCATCGAMMHDHGWIDEGPAGWTVCPGDFVVTYSDEKHFPMPAEVFNSLFEAGRWRQADIPLPEPCSRE